MSLPHQLSELAPEVSASLRPYMKRVTAALGERLEAIVVYGSAVRGEFRDSHSNINVLVIVQDLDGDLLRTLTPVLAKWKLERVITLLMTTTEVRHWAELFPLEFGDLLEFHLLLAGRDPFQSLRPDLTGMLEASLREVHATVLRVRQRFLEGGGTNEAALILIPLSMTTLGACLRGLLRAWDLPVAQETEAVVQAVCTRLALDPAPFLEGWALRCGQITPGPLEVPRLFDRYLAALHRLSERLTVMGS